MTIKKSRIFSESLTVSSGICDGAGMIIVASEEACTKHDLTPLARLVDYRLIFTLNFFYLSALQTIISTTL